MKTFVSAAFLGASLLASTNGFLVADALADPPKGGNLVYDLVSGPGTLDPYVSSSAVELEVIHHIYEPLVTIGEHYETAPMLASKIDISPDAKTFTFTLRDGVKFQNGKVMTSADVVASFERYRCVSPNAAVFTDVESYSAPDPSTFVVKLSKPNAVFVDILKSPVYPFEILPAEEKDKAPREIDIIGTGPFQLGEWVKDSHLVLKRFDGYTPNESYKGPDGFGGNRTAYLDTVRYNFVPEANGRVAALQAGEADVVASIPPDLAKRFEGNPDIEVKRGGGVVWLRARNARFLRLVGRAIPLAAQSLYVGWVDSLSSAFRPQGGSIRQTQANQPTLLAISASKPLSSVAGVGGQPGISKSTGITVATPSAQA
jgi:peptide/nickel transport system substrate-binding protein